MELEENKKLIPVRMSYNSDSTWSFRPSENEYYNLSFNADDVSIKRLLRRMKAKDSITYPNSRKGTTYQAMIDDIKSKASSTIYIWKSRCPKSDDLLNALLDD